MANKKITDLTLSTTPASNDLLEIVDVSDTTESAEGSSKKVEAGSLAGNLQQTTTNGATTDVPITIKQTDNSESITFNPAYFSVNADNGVDPATSYNVTYQTPTDSTGSGELQNRDVGANQEVVAWLSDLPVIAEIVATGANSSSITETYSLGVQVMGNRLNDNEQLEAVIRVGKTGTAGTVTVRYYANATNNMSGTPILLGTVISISATRVQAMQKYIDIIKKDGTGNGTFTTDPTTSSSNDLGGTGAGQNVAIDWTTNPYLVVTVRCSNAGDTAFAKSIKLKR